MGDRLSFRAEPRSGGGEESHSSRARDMAPGYDPPADADSAGAVLPPMSSRATARELACGSRGRPPAPESRSLVAVAPRDDIGALLRSREARQRNLRHQRLPFGAAERRPSTGRIAIPRLRASRSARNDNLVASRSARNDNLVASRSARNDNLVTARLRSERQAGVGVRHDSTVYRSPWHVSSARS